jgi:hypothetical protein
MVKTYPPLLKVLALRFTPVLDKIKEVQISYNC